MRYDHGSGSEAMGTVQSCGSGSRFEANLSNIYSGVWQYILHSLVSYVFLINISQVRNCGNMEFFIMATPLFVICNMQVATQERCSIMDVDEVTLAE